MSGFRFDIQGLRAIAVLTVLLYHAGLPWTAGGFVGVDIFFVISGYLITGGIVREIRVGRGFSFWGFYARRAARILPAATVALVGVVGLTMLLMPVTRWEQVGRDALGSAVYIVNWMFAGSSLDYMARDQAPSPLQHFWSLAVEEQFYILWPLLLVIAAVGAMKLGRTSLVGFGAALAVVAIPSFIYSIYLTGANPGAAYFVTTTRMWELCIGAALAIYATQLRSIPPVIRGALGWIGIAAIAAAVFTFDATTPFPSFTALLPVAGAAAIILAGDGTTSRLGVSTFLGTRPMVWVGGLSYSLYLWHWPLLVIAAAVFGELSWPAGLLVVSLAFGPAWLSLRLIEKPFLSVAKDAHHNKETIGQSGLMTLAAMVIAVLVMTQIPPAPAAATFTPKDFSSSTQLTKEPVGAEVILKDLTAGSPKDSFKSITPSPLAASKDMLEKACLQGNESVEAVACTYGAKTSARTIVLIGDSHAAMLIPGLHRAAGELGLKLVTYTKGSCPFIATDVMLDGRPYTACTDWGKNVTAEVLDLMPVAVLTASSRYNTAAHSGLSQVASIPHIAEGMRRAWEPIARAGVPVIAVRDTPRPDVIVPDCVASNESALSRCAWPKAEVLWDRGPGMLAAEGLPGVSVMDLTDALCPADMCPSVIGDTLIYRDGNHLTATYSESMHGQIADRLRQVIN